MTEAQDTIIEKEFEEKERLADAEFAARFAANAYTTKANSSRSEMSHAEEIMSLRLRVAQLEFELASRAIKITELCSPFPWETHE